MHNALSPELSLPFHPSTISLAPASYSLHIYLPLIFAREQVIKSQSNNDVDIFGQCPSLLTCFAFAESFACSNCSYSRVICALTILLEPKVSIGFYSQKTIENKWKQNCDYLIFLINQKFPVLLDFCSVFMHKPTNIFW